MVLRGYLLSGCNSFFAVLADKRWLKKYKANSDKLHRGPILCRIAPSVQLGSHTEKVSWNLPNNYNFAIDKNLHGVYPVSSNLTSVS